LRVLQLTVLSASVALARPRFAATKWKKFADRYKKVAGEWNDEAGTKVYALEIILATLKKAGPEAISNVELFKKAMPDFTMQNPFIKEDKQLKYVGTAYFSTFRSRAKSVFRWL
jgi:branched-chain amino acid transport system substrate-binding protein